MRIQSIAEINAVPNPWMGVARPVGPFINGQLGTKAVVLSCSLGVEPEMKKAKGGLFSEKFSQEHT